MRRTLSLVLTLVALVATAPSSIEAQLRPSIEAELLVLWPNLDDRYINSRWLHGAVGVSTPIVRGTRLSWVGSAQIAGKLAGSGEDLDCMMAEGHTGCVGHMDVSPRGALLTGVAYHDQSIILRLQGGVARYHREWGGAKNAPQARVDIIFPPRSKVGLTISAAHAWFGDHLGQTLRMSAFGVGMRFVP